jgi:hypothetical protein
VTWRLLLVAVATTNNPLVTLITDDSPAPGSLARRRALHPIFEAPLGDTTLAGDRLDALRRGPVLEFTRFQSWQLYIDALHDDGAALRELRAALHGDATRYRPDLMVPPSDEDERLVWEAERAHTLRLSEILDEVARYGRRLPETLYTSDIYNLARSVPWRPERSPSADDARAIEAIRERARQAGASRETGESNTERARYDAMAEAVVLVLGTYGQSAAHRFGSRRGDRKERIIPERLPWFDRWLWFAQSVRRATIAILLERPYPAPYGSGGAASRRVASRSIPDEPGREDEIIAGPDGSTPDRAFLELVDGIGDERLRVMIGALNARERAILAATAAGCSTRETQALLAESGVWIGATASAIDTCRHRLRAKARRALIS